MARPSRVLRRKPRAAAFVAASVLGALFLSLALALFLAMLVGLSRIYVGVHWLTDVVAGWAAGAAWSALCWLLARWLQRSGQVESGRGR